MKRFILFVLIGTLFCNSQIICKSINSESPSFNDSLTIIEKVYLHTDRNCYYPGDDIWFKAYLIDATYRRLSNHSNNLHVELISTDSKIILSRIIRIDFGLGNGDFHIPEEIRSGRYHLRAYTNYMRNFSDQLFFNKEIVVINSLDTLSKPDDEINYIKNKIDISFYPEGGSLIDNVSSVVAFKAVDARGKGCDISGKIYSSKGDFVTEFKSVHLGMGSFFLRPAPGLNYYSIIRTHDSVDVKTVIPWSFSTGMTLSVSVTRNNELAITARTNPQNLSLFVDQDFLLTISSRKILLKTILFKLRSSSNNFIIPVNDIPDGIVMLTLSALNNLPLAERLIYIQRDRDLRVSIEPDKQIYSQRDSVSVKISLTGDTTETQVAFLSLSAVENKFADNSSQFPSTISSWFLLESDVRGPVEDPSYYFNPSNPDRLRDMDLLLRTQGWRDFEWKYKDNDSFLPETGFTISGKLTKLYAKKPLEDSRVNIGIFGSSNNFMTIVQADSSGRFRLEGINLTGEARLIASSIGNKNHLQGKLFLDSLKYKPAGISDSLLPKIELLKEDLAEMKQQYEIKSAIRKKYKLSDTINLGEITIIAKKPQDLKTIRVENSRTLYKIPDKEIIITPQLEIYPNVIELLRGRVAGVQVSGDLLTSDYQIIMRGPGSIMLDNNPLVLIDGIKGNFRDLVNMPLFIIDRVDIIKPGGSTAIFGMEGSNGVISIISKTTDRLSAYNTVSHSVNTKISGYDAARIFYSPKHSRVSEQTFLPDQRTILFWKPNIRLDAEKDLFLNYFNADNSSTIRINVEGITTDGIPVTGTTEYEIR
jgi:hypothetical protein